MICHSYWYPYFVSNLPYILANCLISILLSNNNQSIYVQNKCEIWYYLPQLIFVQTNKQHNNKKCNVWWLCFKIFSGLSKRNRHSKNDLVACIFVSLCWNICTLHLIVRSVLSIKSVSSFRYYNSHLISKVNIIKFS